VIGLDDFGASAPAADLYEHFELTAAHVRNSIERYLRATPR
jgi:transketolase